MSMIAWALLFGASLVATSEHVVPRQIKISGIPNSREEKRELPRRVIGVDTTEELASAFEGLTQDVTVRLAPGKYVVPIDIRFSEWAVSGRNVRIVGAGRGSTVFETTPNIRVRFSRCTDCALDSVSMGSLSIEESSMTISECTLYDGSIGSEGSTVRISNSLIEHGIHGRGGKVVIEQSEIVGGIEVGGDGHLEIKRCLIEGTAPGGGTGLVVTGPATVIAQRNHFRGLTTGIQLQGNASLEFTANIVENVDGIGIWGTLPGLGRVSIMKNVIYHCGASGIALRADGDQGATRNIVVETGLVDPKESAVVVIGAHADAAVRKNTLYANTVTEPKFDRDVSREAFWRARRPWTRTYRNNPVGVDGRHKFYESAFLTRYGRWGD